ncbi:MAG: hypothetical protein NT018_11490 [Armatimonadetes bacterium]|nr:hypothetical protein [Armatimonadota bacterium]
MESGKWKVESPEGTGSAGASLSFITPHPHSLHLAMLTLHFAMLTLHFAMLTLHFAMLRLSKHEQHDNVRFRDFRVGLYDLIIA